MIHQHGHGHARMTTALCSCQQSTEQNAVLQYLRNNYRLRNIVLRHEEVISRYRQPSWTL